MKSSFATGHHAHNPFILPLCQWSLQKHQLAVTFAVAALFTLFMVKPVKAQLGGSVSLTNPSHKYASPAKDDQVNYIARGQWWVTDPQVTNAHYFERVYMIVEYGHYYWDIRSFPYVRAWSRDRLDVLDVSGRLFATLSPFGSVVRTWRFNPVPGIISRRPPSAREAYYHYDVLNALRYNLPSSPTPFVWRSNNYITSPDNRVVLP